MNMRTDIWKGIAAVGLLLMMGMNAQAQCPNTAMAVTQEATGCGADVNFAVTNDIGFQSVQWSVDGEPFSTQQAGTVFFNPGTYVFEVVTIGTDMCTSLMEEVVTVSGGITANIFSDTIACNGNLGGIGPQVSGGSGDYSFQWEPAASVNDPTVQYPMITASFSQLITVAVTDNVTGCTASDSLYFYPNIQTNATVELCSGTAELTLDPGSMVYAWTAVDSDGNPIDMSGVTGNSFTATELGTYEVMTYYSGCNQVVHAFEVVAGLEISVPDTFYICAGACVEVIPLVSGGSPPYIYLWNTGAVGLTQVLCQQGVYTLTIHDGNGCFVTRQFVILEHPTPQLEITYSMTTENCATELCFQTESGFASYAWIDNIGTGSNTQSFHCFTVTTQGTYWVQLIIADANGCSHLFSSEEVTFDPCPNNVWPGDVNFDGIADNEDALWLGLAFDQTGPVRPDASLVWEGQPAPDWNFNFSQNNVNLKHADTDGNGVVNFSDTIAISQNYGQTHGKADSGLAGSSPALWVEAVPDTVGESQAVNITVHLGTAAQPVDSLHGIAFTLTWDESLVTANELHIDFTGNVLGTVGSDVLTLQMPFPADGQADLAISRTTLENFSGYGPLVNARIVTTDNLSGIHELRIGVSGITAITANEFPVELASVPDTVIIDPDHVGIGEAFGADLRIHPNPTNGIVRLDGLSGDVAVEVLDATGRTVSRSGNNGSPSLLLDLSAQPEGFYLLRLSGRDGVAVRRVVKSH